MIEISVIAKQQPHKKGKHCCCQLDTFGNFQRETKHLIAGWIILSFKHDWQASEGKS